MRQKEYEERQAARKAQYAESAGDPYWKEVRPGQNLLSVLVNMTIWNGFESTAKESAKGMLNEYKTSQCKMLLVPWVISGCSAVKQAAWHIFGVIHHLLFMSEHTKRNIVLPHLIMHAGTATHSCSRNEVAVDLIRAEDTDGDTDDYTAHGACC